jgi:(1->4)-alpha-D-glucan 1-alpha-D-glucosylmutase
MRTSWTGQDQPYEEAVERFVRQTLDPEVSRNFLDDFLENHRDIALAGGLYSLSQTLIKLTAPGVPDVYRGSELWELSLVDPDNRRPVDFAKLEEMLSELKQQADAASLLKDWKRGAIKLYLLEKGLQLRQARAALFECGDYTPLHLTGAHSGSAVAYLRGDGQGGAITVAPIRALSLLKGQETPIVPAERWEDTAISLPDDWAGRTWRNLLTGETMTAAEGKLPLSEVLQTFPVALLATEED